MEQWPRLKLGVVRHTGAGLLAAAVLSLVEVALLIAIDGAAPGPRPTPWWQPLTGLPWALIAYGLLGLLGGLVLGLVRGRLARRVPGMGSGRFGTDLLPGVLILAGAFLVAAHRVCRDLRGSALVAGGVFLATVALVGGLWVLLR